MPQPPAGKLHSEPGSQHHSGAGTGKHENESTAEQPQTSVHPEEPEDAYLTGTSRSLQRRVLGLNVEGKQAQEHPETAAGQHATGSFTGKKSSRRKSA
jgi:hypothetical protein